MGNGARTRAICRRDAQRVFIVAADVYGAASVTALTLVGVLAERQRAERAQANLIERLQRAINEIKVLRGLVPICAWCKRIRNDTGLWQQLETYLGEHSEAEFSHCICPECAEMQRASVLPKDFSDHAP